MKNYLRKIYKPISLIAVFVTFTSAQAQIGELIWEDQFNTLNSNVWNADVGNGCEIGLCGWGNQELEYYREENLSIESIPGESGNNALVMEAKRESIEGFAYTSGKVTSEGNLSVHYGMIEIRMRTPDLDTGLWPAAWLLGTANVSWPAKGEIDMMEMGHRDEEITNQGHPGTNQNNYVGANAIFANEDGSPGSIAFDVGYNKPYVASQSMANRFVTYRIYWQPTELRFTVIDNGVENDLYEGPLPLSPDDVTSPFTKPFYFLMNLAVGGNFTDAATVNQVNAPLPSKLYIDYVKVYEWNGFGSVEFDYAELASETGPFGVFTEETEVSNQLSFGLDAEIFVWGGTMQDGTTKPYEGSEVIAWETLNPNAWFGGGVSSTFGRDMSEYVDDGVLKFNLKVPADLNFRIGITDNFTNESWIEFPARENNYGLVRNGEWSQVEIPLADFAGLIAFQNINYMFAISSIDGSFPTSSVQIGIDNIVWDDGNDVATTIPVTGVTTSPASLSLEVGETQTLSASITPNNASNQNVTWRSSNTSVATVNANGVVTTQRNGNATITATTNDGNFTDTTNISVSTTSVDTGNLALNGNATQSSTGFGGVPSRAIDGNTSGIWTQGSVTHTNRETNAWWQVDLGTTENIGVINIFNRTDSCCTNRLDNFTVSVINNNGTTTFSQSYTTAPDPSISLNANGASGQIIRVELDDTNYLSLAEVEVFESDGTETTNPNTLFIEAEDFTAMNGIQLENTDDVGGGQNVGYIDSGDWLEYSVNIPTSGTYTISSRVASTPGNAAFQIIVDGTVLGTTNVYSTGGWQSWITLSTSINLSAGNQTIRLLSVGDGFNINWFEIVNSNTAAKNDINNNETVDITLYPNPIKDSVNISISNFEDYTSIEVIDINGRIITDMPVTSQITSCSLNNINNGIYLVRLYKSGTVSNVLKFIK